MYLPHATLEPGETVTIVRGQRSLQGSRYAIQISEPKPGWVFEDMVEFP
jgi:hypothetical protein